MRKLIKYSFPPEGFGIIACILLIISRYMNITEFPWGQALNHFIVVFVLCLCVHFVRRTAGISHKHVWDNPLLFAVSVFPVFNLCFTALQLILGDKPFFASPVLISVAILFSLPLFFCLYFLYVYKMLLHTRVFKICSIILLCFGGTYTVFRMFDLVIFPLIEATGTEVNIVLKSAADTSAIFSMVTYAMSVLCFGVMWATRAKEKQK